MTQILLPFQLGYDNTIATTSDPSVITQQHVDSLVSTVQGERVMLPAYGLNLAGIVFGGNDPVLQNLLQNEVTAAFQQWEPGIQLTSVSQAQSTDAQIGVAAVDVTYVVQNPTAVGASATPVYQTANMTIGGTITNGSVQ